MEIFRANGKLLLTGEYFILDGATGLAVPAAKGQTLRVQQHHVSRFLHWESKDHEGNIWLEGTWDPSTCEWGYISHPEKAKYLTTLLEYAGNEMGLDLSGYHVTTEIDFPLHWGLGSSSTLISLLAQWWRTNPYYLLQITFGGSGYDIACATAKGPIVYQLKDALPKTEPVEFHPAFSDSMYFLYLNQKQDSREGIRHYRSLTDERNSWITEINDITNKVLKCNDFDEMEYLLSLHEVIVSRALSIEKVKDRLFPEYWGAIKSLGAWGGDFVWITSSETAMETRNYFSSLGYNTLIPYNEMILQK